MGLAKVDPAFWRNKKVLLTGHTGFKGSWLSLWLVWMGARVIGVALPPATRPSIFKAAGVEDVVSGTHMLDIRQREKLVQLVRKVKPEIVIHMAAQPLVRASYLDPVATYETNVMGAVNVLEAVRQAGSVRALVNVTTDKCYENLECFKGYREDDRLGGHDPYSSSKACSEIVTAAYQRSFFHAKDYRKHGLGIATARAGNVIGGGDWSTDRLVPDCVRACIKGREIVLRSPTAVRPWQHVLEPLSGYLVLAQKLFKDGKTYSSAWNFGPEKKDVWTVREVAENICSVWGGKSRVRCLPLQYPHEAMLLMLDITKAKKHLGWSPTMRVVEALALTVEWYKQWHDGARMQDVTLKQISNYQQRDKL